jgi:putative cell wall-binding protein
MSKKSTKALASATLMTLVLTTALSAGPVKAAQGKVTRIGEVDRYATAAKVATGNWTTSDNVVLVSGEGYADAVSASALAKNLNAPILLTPAGSLNSDTQAALNQLKPKNVYVIGGEASVSSAVRSTLKTNSYNVIELGGANRYETNAKVAQKLVDLGVKADEVIMVGGEGFSDALSVAPVAAAKGQILLLGMNNSSYMQPVLDFVSKNKSKVTVVGTKNVINESILSTVNGTRVDGGSDRFDTNLKVLASFKDTLKMDKLYVASAQENSKDDGYADALVASALAGKTAAPLVLVDKDGSTATTSALKYIKDNAKTTTDLNIIGGTGVVSQNIEDEINGGKVDPTPDATVKSVEVVSLNQIKVTFNTQIDTDSAEDVTNYKIDGTQLTQTVAKDGDASVAVDENGAVAKSTDDDHAVLITLAHPRKQSDSVTFTVKKAVLSSDKDYTVDGSDTPLVFKDTENPTLKNVTVEGNSQLTVEFSEAVNMKTIDALKDKFKIDGKSISNYGINSTYTELKDHITVPSAVSTPATWANKVMFYFDSQLESGSHTLNIATGDGNTTGNIGLLSDVGGFSFQEQDKPFTVDTMSTAPVPTKVEETKSGEIHLTFDRSMDVQTVKNLSNYKINNKSLGDINGAIIKTDNDDKLIKLKHISDGTIKTGANTLDISDDVKDAFGNTVPKDTRESFNDVKDETKPTINKIEVIDSETVRVRFSKDVDFEYASNISNYTLKDEKGTDITERIRGVYSTVGESDTGNTDTYNLKLWKYKATMEKAKGIAVSDGDESEDWRLTSNKYTLTVKNIRDTASTPNVMEDYTFAINDASDTINPKGTGIYAKMRGTGDKDKVVVYFSESMDSATLTNKDNYQFINGEGDSKSLPSDTNITTGGDNKSAILEFPSSYHVVTGGKISNGTTNDVSAVSVSNVKDTSGNKLDGVAYSNNDTISKALAGATVKENTIRTFYDTDDSGDLKIAVQFSRAISTIHDADITFGGVVPSSHSLKGDTVTFKFDKNQKATADDIKNAPKVTYANGLTNTTPTKIALVKGQGQNLKLAINASSESTDETGGRISSTLGTDGTTFTQLALSDKQAKIYNNDARPRTSCYDDDKADFWTATKDNTGGKVYVTFDTPLDAGNTNADDFVFMGKGGSQIKADSASVSGNTVIFNFKNDKNYDTAFTGSLDIHAQSSASFMAQRDANGEKSVYKASNDDTNTRTISITDNTVVTPDVPTATVEQAGTAVLGKTVVVASLPSTVDATKYDVTVNGTKLAYNATSGKFTATIDGTFTVAQLQALTTVAAKAVVVVPTATVEQAGTAILGKTVVVASLPSTADATLYNVVVNGTTLTYSATSAKFTATIDGTFTIAQLQALTTVSAK